MATLEFVRTELVRKREKGEGSNRALMPFGMSAQGGSNRAGIRASISCSRIRQDSGGAKPTGRVQKSGDICYGRNEGALVFLDRRSRNG